MIPTRPALEPDPPVARCPLVVIAASAGGVLALRELLGQLPGDFPAAVVIVQHRTSQPPQLLEQVLGRATTLPVRSAAEGEALRAGVVYVAPPDLHVTVGPDHALHLADGHLIHHVRSSADPLFASAARLVPDRLVAVVLTGSGQDATEGACMVKAAGGIVLAQDPASSQYASMPRSAIASGAVDEVLPLAAIGARLVELTRP